MFDGVFENKVVGATVITSAIAVVLTVGCCCVKKCVYNKPKSKPEIGRERLESHAIPSANSAFTIVQPSAPPMDTNLQI